MMKHLKTLLRLLHQHEDRTPKDLTVCFLMHLFWFYSSLCFMKGALQQEDVIDQLKALTPCYTMTLTFTSYCAYLVQRREYFVAIRELENQFEANPNKSDKNSTNIVLSCHVVAERSLLRFSILLYSNVVLFAIEPVLTRLRSLLTGEEVRSMYPFTDSFSNLWNVSGIADPILAYVTQMIHYQPVVLIFVLTTAIPMYFFMTVVALLKITRSKFMVIGHAKGTEAMALLRSAIVCHIEALEFLKKVKQLGQYQYFVMFYSGAAGLSFWCFALAMDFSLTNAVVCVPLTLTWLFYIMTLCDFGQKIIDENAKLAYAIYDVPWYAHTPQFRRLLALSLMRAQRTHPVRALGFSDLSYESFRTIATTAYSYMTFLQTANE